MRQTDGEDMLLEFKKFTSIHFQAEVTIQIYVDNGGKIVDDQFDHVIIQRGTRKLKVDQLGRVTHFDTLIKIKKKRLDYE